MIYPLTVCGQQTPQETAPHLPSACCGMQKSWDGLGDCLAGLLGQWRPGPQVGYVGLPRCYHITWTQGSCAPEGHSLKEKLPGKTETPERAAGVGARQVQAGVPLAFLGSGP